jgi:surface antigen
MQRAIRREFRRESIGVIQGLAAPRARVWRAAVAVLAAVSATTCASMKETYEDNPKAVLGTVVGAAVGVGIVALAGGTPGSMAAAGAAGALVGGFLGNRLDERDKRMAREAANKAFESGRTGQSTEWSNPDTGNSGSVTPTKTYQLANGQYCRMYTQDIVVSGETHQTHGTACRKSDGTWEVQS